MKSDRNYGIDLIRGLSVFYIVSYWHLFNYTEAFRGYYNPVTHYLTRIILASFVFISGYLIASKNQEITWRNVLIFWSKRLIRIYPLYLLALCLFYWRDIASSTTLIKAGFLLSMFSPPAPPTLWFITMIMIFYLLAPFFLRYVNNLPFYLGLSIVFWLVFFFKGTWEISLFFPSFIIGMWLQGNPKWLNKLKQQQFGLTIIFIILYIAEINKVSDWLFLQIIFINLGAILFYFYSCQIMNKVRQSSIVATLSYSSFCMYLFHRPIFSVTQSIFFPNSEIAQVIYLLGVGVPLIILISWLIQKLYDRLMLSSRLFSSPKLDTNKEKVN